jgi:hypothetical protein
MARVITRAELAQLEGLLSAAASLHDALEDLHDVACRLTRELDALGHTYEAIYGEGDFDALALLTALRITVAEEDDGTGPEWDGPRRAWVEAGMPGECPVCGEASGFHDDEGACGAPPTAPGHDHQGD